MRRSLPRFSPDSSTFGAILYYDLSIFDGCTFFFLKYFFLESSLLRLFESRYLEKLENVR